MLFKKIDVQTELKKARILDEHLENSILSEVQDILNTEEFTTPKLKQNAEVNKSYTSENQLNFDFLVMDKIFHISSIKKICIDYRLRFLDIKYFKSTIPKDAVYAIREMENLHNTKLSGLKIMAPSKLFKLEDKNDPLLFVPLGNDYYYLLAKWGNDLHPLRKLAVWPLKNMPNLALSILAISFLLTFLVPIDLLTKKTTGVEFWLLFFFMFKISVAIVLFYGISLGKNFTPFIWNSKYFNV